MHGTPGFLHVVQGNLDYLVHHCLFDAGKFTAFDLGLRTRAAKDIFHQGEYQAGIDNYDRIAAQGLHLENVYGGGHRQGTHELAELGHVYADGVQLHALSDRIGKSVCAKTRKTVVDDFKNRHPAADNTVLIGQVKRDNAFLINGNILFAFYLSA